MDGSVDTVAAAAAAAIFIFGGGFAATLWWPQHRRRISIFVTCLGVPLYGTAIYLLF